jgi:cysteinyl-tRNA synthetase
LAFYEKGGRVVFKRGMHVKQPIAWFYISIFLLLINRCTSDESRDYRQDMRSFVQEIDVYAKSFDPGFLVIAQNGQELITENGETDGIIVQDYIDALDGAGREDLYYGFDEDDVPTPAQERIYMSAFLDRAENSGVEVLVIDYCSSAVYVDSSYDMSEAKGYIAFAADHRELDHIPVYPSQPYNMNTSDITSLADAGNFLYLINTQLYASKSEFLDELQNTDYDILIIDLFYNEDEQFDLPDIASLKNKAHGGTRLVLAYCSIGEAEDYRYYWQAEWNNDPPVWLGQENPNWPGNYLVEYWSQDWQDIIYGDDDSYIKKILDAGFSGVYLDIIDAFEYFENE